MTNTEHMRKRLLDSAGVCESKAGNATLAELERTEWSPQFERFMRNRLVMGAIRYGRFGDPCKSAYDHIGEIVRRARKYNETGNDELLVDIANLAMVEFVEGSHPTKHFEAGDDTQHCNKIST